MSNSASSSGLKLYLFMCLTSLLRRANFWIDQNFSGTFVCVSTNTIYANESLHFLLFCFVRSASDFSFLSAGLQPPYNGIALSEFQGLRTGRRCCIGSSVH